MASTRPTVVGWLESQRQQYADQPTASLFEELLKFYNAKLWYQLGEVLLQMLRDPHFRTNKRLLEAHRNLVSVCGPNLDPLLYARFSAAASEQFEDPKEALEFMRGISKELLKVDHQALIIASAAQLPRLVELKEEVASEIALEELKLAVDSYPGVLDNACSAAYHHAALVLSKVQGNAGEYFRHAMLYLTYTPLESLNPNDKLDLAADVGLAALCGEKLYNLGELLQHQVVSSLMGTKHEWIVTLLRMFNNGQVAEFERVFPKLSQEHVELKNNEYLLQEKIRIMALIATVFNRTKEGSIYTFDELATACHVDVSKIELLVLKALSLGVIKGEVDGVENTVHIRWVQPRVLDMAMIQTMRDNISKWRSVTKDTAQLVEDNTKELLGSKFD